MTPNDIEVLIYCHCGGGRPHPRLNTPAVKGSIEMFIQKGLIEGCSDEKDIYFITNGGKALIKLLCNVELPRQAWIDKDNKIIE